MTLSRGRYLHETPGRPLIACIALLLGVLALAGCTQPVIPAPTPAQTTPATVATTRGYALPPATTVQATTNAPDYLTYTNSRYGFSISYPSGWTVQENAAPNIVTFTAPTSGGVGVIPATLRVLVDDLSTAPMSLDQFRAAQLAKKQSMDKFDVIYDLPYKGNGYSGWRLGYTYDTGTIMRTFDTYAIRGTMAYTVSFTCRDDQFATYSTQSDAMFKSFQLI